MEIAVSVAILGLALITLLVMNTNYLQAYDREAKRFKASLYAKKIMSMIEIDKAAPDPGRKAGNLVDRLRELKILNDATKSQEKEQLRGWRYELEVQKIPVAKNEDALRRVDLSISWGTRPDERTTLVYFTKP